MGSRCAKMNSVAHLCQINYMRPDLGRLLTKVMVGWEEDKLVWRPTLATLGTRYTAVIAYKEQQVTGVKNIKAFKVKIGFILIVPPQFNIFTEWFDHISQKWFDD